MKKFINKIFIFLIPIALYLIVVAIMDPYSFFSNSTVISSEAKENVSFKLNYPLFKLLKFEHAPKKNIILGDSRSKSLDPNLIDGCSKTEYSNLAYGGGTLQEAILTFWEVSKTEDLTKVAIGINFDLYNASNNNDRVSEAIGLKNNFISYGSSRYVFKSMAVILKNKILNKPYTVGVPEMTTQEFWDYQLNSAANNVYRIYKYPDNYFSELKKIKQYCQKNNIELIFFIPPTHIELQKKIQEFDLVAYQKKFKADLKSLGSFYDFDFPNALTNNKENFDDPYHCTDAISKIVTETVFCKKISTNFSNYFDYYE